MEEREHPLSPGNKDREERIIDFFRQTGIKGALGASVFILAAHIGIRLIVGKKLKKLVDDNLPKGLARVVKFFI